MSEELGRTLYLHQRIRKELDEREVATKGKEAEARRMFDEALEEIAAERRAINQYREVLTQAENMYHAFSGTAKDSDATGVPQPSEAEAVSAIPDPASASALLTENAEPPSLTDEVGPALSLDEETANVEAQSVVDQLRRAAIVDAKNEGRSGNWWTAMWKGASSRSSEDEASWKALPPVKGAAYALWNDSTANQAEDSAIEQNQNIKFA